MASPSHTTDVPDRPGPSRVQLAVTLIDGATARNVEIDADAAATVEAVTVALADEAGAASHGALFSDRIGRLDPRETIGDAGLRSGDVVALGGLPASVRAEASPQSGAARRELVVSGGPSAGLRVALAPGTYVVGRDPDADVVLDDSSMSRRHVTVTVHPDGDATVSDAGSSNGTAVEGVGLAEDEARTVGTDTAIEAGRSTLRLGAWRDHDSRVASGRGTVVAFNRPPRVARGYEPPSLRMDPPPNAARAIRIPLIVAIVPVFMGITLFLITKSPMMLTMAVFSPVMLIGSSLSERRSGRREHKEQLERFDKGLVMLRGQLADARQAEQAERRAVTPDAGDLVGRAVRHLPDLWERRPADRDYLDVRVATADQPSVVSVSFQPGGDPTLRAQVDDLLSAYASVPVVPVHLRGTELDAIGLVGDRGRVDALGRWLAVQLCTMQSPRDLVLTAALDPTSRTEWDWLSWLPHCTSPTSPLDGEHIVTGARGARELVRSLTSLAEERRAENAGLQRAPRRTTVVLIIDERVAPEGTLIDALLEGAAELDIFTVWLGHERRHLPGACGAIVDLAAERAVADVTWRESGRTIAEASADGITREIAEAVARSLAPVRDTTAGGAAAQVPRTVSLVEVLDVIEPEASAILARWDARVQGRLDGILGIGADGPYSIDLRSDGPHGLVAGTTGAGKSELLQTLIASLALTHPPDRLAFLLVDYKGGAAFKDCVRLPHSVGMVTDLDEHQVHRALVSLNAELKRREHILHEAGARDLMELERRDPSAPPSLVIVIDEFATLAKEVPDFVAGVVDVAQRGRSLGVHLLLATQRPGNAVTENIRANTNLRIALRVAGPTESDDVLGAPDASRLPRSLPGRAYVRRGPTELDLVQVGFVGARTSRQGSTATIEVHPLASPFDRADVPTDAGPSRAETDDAITDLDLVVDAVDAATTARSIARPASPWLPPLNNAIGLETLGGSPAEGSVTIGLLDEPSRQRQAPYALDLASVGNVLIFGGTGSGKTTTLRSIAAALARGNSSKELHLYGLDFSGRGLAVLERIPHCGSVIAGDDHERIARLLARLRRTIDERSKVFAERQVGTLAEFRRAFPDDELPRVVVLLDSYAGFQEAYERVDMGALTELLPRLVADGRATGVHFVMTADRRGAVPTSVASLVPARIVLRMGSDDEYGLLGVDVRTISGTVLPPGRGFIPGALELQIATQSGGADAEAELRALQALGDALGANEAHGAPEVARLGTEIDAAILPTATTALTAAFALDDLDLAPTMVDLRDAHCLVVGSYRSGRSTALHTMTRGLQASDPDLRVHLLAPRRSWLVDEPWDSVASGMEACEARIAELLDEMYLPDRDASPSLIVIDDIGEFVDAMSATALTSLVRKGRDARVRILASLEKGSARHYADFIRELKKDGRGLLLDPNLDLDGELFGVRLPRNSNAAFPAGRGYFVKDGVVTLCQVARVGR